MQLVRCKDFPSYLIIHISHLVYEDLRPPQFKLLNLFKYSYNTSKANRILSDFEKNYPNWIMNKSLNTLPMFKRIYVKCARYRMFVVLFLLSRFHSFMLK